MQTHLFPVTPAPRLAGSSGIWPQPARIGESNFVHKSLSNWNFNIAVGCAHGCRFCYVPSLLKGRMSETMSDYGVADPDADWGKYVLLRRWDRDIFLHSLSKAELTDPTTLESGGNRAVIYCSTTDPYQVFRGQKTEGEERRENQLHHEARGMVRESLELIRDYSTLNVRILTRSPMAILDFDLFKSFGQRLMFGMSLPTLNDRLAQIYEPNAPSPSARLRCLERAAQYGLNTFVAVAPMYPEIDRTDLERTLSAVAGLERAAGILPAESGLPARCWQHAPLTIFAEPINIRAENVARIATHADRLGLKMRVEVFESRRSWEDYAIGQLRLIEDVSGALGLSDRLHLWPDHTLGSRHTSERQPDPAAYMRWITGWWVRRSEWPGGADAPKS
jgi:DNA repair photolyase